jgi:hypothetical protein
MSLFRTDTTPDTAGDSACDPACDPPPPPPPPAFDTAATVPDVVCAHVASPPAYASNSV